MFSSVSRMPAAPRWPERAPAVVGVVLIGAAAAVLTGWALGVPLLLTWLPGVPPMKANTAVAFVFAGSSLLALRAGVRFRTFGIASAIAVVLVGLATLYQYATGTNLGIDELLVRDSLAPAGEAAGRMAHLTAAGFVLGGLHLLLLLRPVRSSAGDALAYLLAIVALPGLMGHAYNFETLHPGAMPGTAMALNTSVLLMLFALALALSRPESALKRILESRAAGGLMLRRLMPVAVGIPFVTGSLLLHAQEAGLLGNLGVIALFAASNIIVLGTVVLWNAFAIDRGELSRSTLAAIVQSSSDSIVGTDLNARITSWNPGAEALYGYTAAEALGQHVTLVSPPGAEPLVQGLLQRALAGETISNHETTRLRKDGSPVEVSLAISPIRDASNAIIGISAITRDISARRRLEATARMAESRFRVLVDQAIVGVYVVDNDRFSYVNRKMADIFGYTPEEMLALPSVMEIVDPADRGKVAERVRLRLETGRSIQYEALGRRKDGSTLHAEIHGAVIDDGKRCLIGMLNDITDRKHALNALAESEARLKEAQSVAHLGSWELDLRSGALHWSDEVYRIFGAEPQAFGATYEYFLDRIHPDDRELVNSAYSQSVASGTPYSIDHRILLADGTLKYVHERCLTEYDEKGHAVRSSGTVQDITDRKLAEEALSRLNEQLESRVRERTAELEAANKELEAFSYSVSHDLRAPLRALQGFSRLLLEEHLPELSPEAARYVGIIRDNAAQMGVLIDDLLTFSRLSRQSVCTGTVDIRALAVQALDQLEPDAEGRQVDVRFGDLPPCVGDAALLRQVLVNLLSNALKFTRRSDPAVIEIGTAPELADGREHVYFIRDNGAGFDMQYSGKLFGIFQRLHSAAEYEGTGVGLAIVQRIVHRHGGRVWPEAAPGQGATFYFSLPKDTTNGAHGR